MKKINNNKPNAVGLTKKRIIRHLWKKRFRNRISAERHTVIKMTGHSFAEWAYLFSTGAIPIPLDLGDSVVLADAFYPLLEKHWSLATTSADERLLIACERGCIRTVQRELEYNDVSKSYARMLIVLASHGPSVSLVKWLVLQHFSPVESDTLEEAAQAAVECDRIETLVWLSSVVALSHARYCKMLETAVANDCTSILRWLLDRVEASPDVVDTGARDNSMIHAVEHACRYDRVACAMILCTARYPPMHTFILEQAVSRGSLRICREWYRVYRNEWLATEFVHTLFSAACTQSGKLEMVVWVFDHFGSGGAHPNILRDVCSASGRKHLDILQWLRDSSADVTIARKCNQTESEKM